MDRPLINGPRRATCTRLAGAMLRWAATWLALAGVAAAPEAAGEQRVAPLLERAWVRFGDDPAWAAAELDLDGWTEVNLRGALRRQGVAEDPAADFLWYRFELPDIRFPSAGSFNLHLAGVSGASQGFINGRPTAQTLQDFTGRIGERPRFPPPGFAHTYRLRESQWRSPGPNVFALRVQRAPRAAGIEDGPALLGIALWLRPLQEAAHRRNDLWEGMALAGLGLGLLTALGLTVADRADWLSRGMIPVFAVLAGHGVLNSHAFFRTPWTGHWQMRAGWICAAAVVLPMLAVAGRIASAGTRRLWLTWGLASLGVSLGLLFAAGLPQLNRAHAALTLLLGVAAGVCGWWSCRGLAAREHRWLLPVPTGLTLLLAIWTGHRLALHLGFFATAEATRPHFYALGLTGLFFLALILRLRGARDDYRRLLHVNITAQEDERRRIARDLHDGVGQALQALKLRLQLERRTGSSGPETACAPDSVDAVDGCIQELRAVAGNLRPVYLGRMPLAEALRLHAEQFARDAGIQVRFESNLTEPVADPVEEHLFRVQQEALNNATRHSRAERIEVNLRTEGRRLSLTVTDDGAAGRDDRNGRPPGHGLRNMRERAELLGGTFRFERRAQGATVVVSVPLNQEEKR